MYFVDRPERLFGFEFGALLFSIRESMMTMTVSLLTLVVMIIHFPLESVEWVSSIPLNRELCCSGGSNLENIISESMLKRIMIEIL